jgi:protein phosphatase
LKIKAKGQTDKGCVRPTNQDAFLVNEQEGLFVVADGMGGHAGGEIASSLCIEQIANYLSKVDLEGGKWSHPDPKINFHLTKAVNFASSKIYERALEEPHLRGMGTTATVAKIMNGHAYFAHVGDSRLYLLRSGFIFQLSFDHSLVNEQLKAGIISEKEAELHHLKNVITRSVGYQEEEDVDNDGFPLMPGDSLILCSDGLHGKVTDQEIAQYCSRGPEAAGDLIELAKKRGGEDNITVIIVTIQD